MSIASSDLVKKYLGILIIGLCSLLLAFFAFNNKCSGIDCIIFKDSKDYKLKEVYQSDETSYRSLFEKELIKLRVDIKSEIKPEKADKDIEITIAKMQRLYEKERSPYPGEISDTIECDEKYIPNWSSKTVRGIKINYATALLNERLVYGDCSENQTKNKSLLVLFYCDNQKKIYNLEFIDDKIDFDKKSEYYLSTIDTLACR